MDNHKEFSKAYHMNIRGRDALLMWGNFFLIWLSLSVPARGHLSWEIPYLIGFVGLTLMLISFQISAHACGLAMSVSANVRHKGRGLNNFGKALDTAVFILFLTGLWAFYFV